MEVCDIEGEKIGSVARLYRRNLNDGDPATQSDHPEILEVSTGPFGWGKHLYIPIEAVQDATQQTLFLRAANVIWTSPGARSSLTW